MYEFRRGNGGCVFKCHITILSTIATSWLDSLKRASRTAAGYKGVSRRDMFKLIPILLFFILSGCAPHFYEAKALRVNAENIDVVSSGELSNNSIVSSDIPLIYVLKRELYTIDFAVSALQLGMRFTQPEGSSYTFSSSDLKENEPFVTKIDAKYTHYISTLEPRDIAIKIFEHNIEVGSEMLTLSIDSCRATVVDAI